MACHLLWCKMDVVGADTHIFERETRRMGISRFLPAYVKSMRLYYAFITGIAG